MTEERLYAKMKRRKEDNMVKGCRIKKCRFIVMNGGFCFEHAAEMRHLVTSGVIKPTTWDRRYEAKGVALVAIAEGGVW